MRLRTAVLRLLPLAGIFVLHVAGPLAQVPRLTVRNASPNGEVNALVDANEVRLTFSEPMIALGAPPAPASVPWFSITPAVKGAFFWTGTRTLIFTPDPASRMPYATRFTVRVAETARAVSGRPLPEPFEFSFTTPTVRLLSADWYRRNGRASDPILVVMRFNQPVRPIDVLDHTILESSPHPWTAPRSLDVQRRSLQEVDPAALARLDAKVAFVQRATSERQTFPARVATAWNEARFPPSETLAVLETTTAPPPDTWINVKLDGNLPSPDGPVRHPAQTSMLRLEPTFFVEDHGCPQPCDPEIGYSVRFRRGIEPEGFDRALAIHDVTSGDAPKPLAKLPSSTEAPRQYRPETGFTSLNPQQVGYPSQPPVSRWRLTLADTLQSTDGQTLGYRWVGTIVTTHARPFAYFTGSLWEADLSGRGRQAPFLARNVEQVLRWVTPITTAELMPRLLQLRQGARGMSPPAAPITQSLRVTPDMAQAHAADLDRVLTPGGTGLAWVGVRPNVTIPGAAVDRGALSTLGTVLQVTNLGLSVKDSPQSTLVFVTRLDTAAPVAGARVSIIDAGNRERWRGTTDREGIATAPAMTLRAENNPWQLSYVVTAEKDGDIAYVASDSVGDLHPSSFGYQYQLREAAPLLRASIFTDRGVYKLGEEVRVKAILRSDTPAGIRTLSPGTSVYVVVRDNRGREVDRRTVPVNAASSAEWTMQVPATGSLGRYAISAGLEAETENSYQSMQRRVTGSFLVAAFRRPDFRVDTTLTSASPPVLGTALKGTVAAAYLFGGPIARQPVRWWVTRQPVIDVPAAIREKFPERQFAFGYLPRPEPGGNALTRVVERTEQLGADGTITADVVAEPGSDAAHSFVFEGDVEGVSGQHIANRSKLSVHPASIYVGLQRPAMFFDTRKGGSIRVLAVDLAGNPRANVPVTVTILREQWFENPNRSSGIYGIPAWDRREVTVGEWTIRTTAEGASLPIPLREGGCFILRGVARDEQGRPTRTELTFYAIGPGPSFWRSVGNRIDLTPERKTWSPGETARILVQTPWERATAIVTVEREGIRSHRQLEITSSQNTVDVPVTEADVPNVYVSVMLVKGRTSTDLGADQSDPGRPQFRVGYTELTVDDASKRLRVEVTADRQEYQPREDLRVAVAVSSPTGTGAGASAAGREVTLWAMDYGLLSLTDYTAPDVARAIYARKALQVVTVDNRLGLITRRMLATAQGQGGAGGGRGGGGALAAAQAPLRLDSASSIAVTESVSVQAGAELVLTGEDAPAVRTDFRPLVFWLGSVTTDANGRATTTVTLPDSLTTYRIMAVASDSASHFGAGDAEIRTTKPVTMLAAFPRFLSAGDRASFGAVVTNNTTIGGDAVITIRSLDTDAIQFSEALTRTVRLAPGESAPVRFDAAARAAGVARIQMAITLGSHTDAFESTLPVLVPTNLETVAAYGDTLASATEKLSIPSGILPRAGGLTVSLASTALVGLDASARYLDEYPYQCAEQKASRALALLLSADLGGAFNLAGVNADEQRRTASRLLDELYGFQCPDGGFTLWAGECRATSAWLTAYVLNVFHRASALRAPVDRPAIDRALNYLTAHLRETPPEVQWRPAWSASQSYALKVLTAFGRRADAELSRLHASVESMPTFALSYFADALHASGDRGARYNDVVRRIGNKLALDADRAHVEEVDDAALVWLWNTNVRATAVVLTGLAERGDDATFLAPLARWLLAARQNGRWGTTQENAVALDALVTYYRAYETEEPQMKATVTLAGRQIGSAGFAGRSTTAQQFRVAMPDLVRDVASAATRELVVARNGTGRLYYTTRLQYLAPESPDPVVRGIRLERRYERYTGEGQGPAGTGFALGDLVRVVVTVTLPHEGRFLAITDPVAAGFEPIDGTLKTTATDIGQQSTTQTSGRDWRAWIRRGGVDHVEKHDDRVMAFATRLAAGRHEFTYLVRATTAGSFAVAGTRGEAMYAPEITGRSAASRVDVK